ncbi:MAG: GDP-mannose 4,6-dehydratase [Gemmatimonadota bacterium]|nr:GDP-mannose 4,6-dehydratase [Gemmatimonadota bacterium]
MKKVLITGGAGFIGSHVADRFLAEGWEVHVIDNLYNGRRQNVPDGAAFHELDIRDAAAADLVRTLTPDVLVHLAAQMDVRKSVADPSFDAQVNVLGSINLLEAVRQHSPSTRVVFSSTGGAVYGDFTEPPNIETFSKNPESPYAISKLAVENYLAYYGRVHGMEYAVMRFANVYGPRQDPHGEAGVVAIFCGRILDGQAMTVFGDGLQTRDYVYVGDVVDATFRGATEPLPKTELLDTRAYNVGTGVPTDVLRLATVLMTAAGTTTAVEHAPERPGEQRTSYLDVSKAGAQLGWRPAVSLEEGLSRSFEWFKARRSTAAPAFAERA